MNVVYMLSNLYTPSLSQHMRSKWMLVIGAGCFTLYFLSFQLLYRLLFFVACGALGFGFATFNVGYMGYLTEISTRRSLERNQALSWMVSCLSVFCAGALYMVVTSTTSSSTGRHSYREYSDGEIRESSPELSSSPSPSVAALESVVVHRRTLLLLPVYLYVGLFFSFWISVFPTTIQFTASLSSTIYLPAYFGMIFSAGSVLMSLVTIFLSKRIANFGLRPIMTIVLFVHISAFILITLSVPEWSTVRPNDDPSLLISLNICTNLLIAFLFGIGDTANNTARTVITSLVIPESKQQTFATSRLFHALAASVLFFASPSLSVYMYMAILSLFLVVSFIVFWVASGLILAEEKSSVETPPPFWQHVGEVKGMERRVFDSFSLRPEESLPKRVL